MTQAASHYRGRRVLVTGGLGFIGSTLARALVAAGAHVTIADAMIPGCGGNPHNIQGIEDRVVVRLVDLRERSLLDDLVRGQDVIFNLAGKISHVDSMRDPDADLENNCRAHLGLLEACRRVNPDTKVVYAGTRQVYGRPEYLPVDERHLVRPTDVNGINKAAGEAYHIVYNNAHGLRACSLRLTNVYGPRQLIDHSRQGFIGWFVRLAIEDAEIQIYGDGRQVRDFVYVDDAVDAFLLAGADDAANGQVLNVGGSEPIAHRDLVALLIDAAGTGRFTLVDWPSQRKAIDIGSFHADSTLIGQVLGWRPTTPLATGLARMVAFCREHWAHYVTNPGQAARL